jgi:hypothetical protein
MARPRESTPKGKDNTKAAVRSPTRVLFYPTYSWDGDSDPAIDVLHTMIDEKGVEIKDLVEKSHVARSTMKNWFSGKTRSPKFCTIAAVAGALGYDYKLVKRKIIMQTNDKIKP